MTPGWLRDTGLPRLREIAMEMGTPMPAFCPRVPIEITNKRVDGEDRVLGVGTLEQVHEDFLLLDRLGAEHVLLDWYAHSDPETLPCDEDGWRQFLQLTAEVIDLKNERVR